MPRSCRCSRSWSAPVSARSSIMNGVPPWSAGREGTEKGRTVIGACSQAAREAISMMQPPPRVTVAVPKVVLEGGSRAGPPGAIHVDPPVVRWVQSFGQGEGRRSAGGGDPLPNVWRWAPLAPCLANPGADNIGGRGERRCGRCHPGPGRCP